MKIFGNVSIVFAFLISINTQSIYAASVFDVQKALAGDLTDVSKNFIASVIKEKIDQNVLEDIQALQQILSIARQSSLRKQQIAAGFLGAVIGSLPFLSTGLRYCLLGLVGGSIVGYVLKDSEMLKDNEYLVKLRASIYAFNNNLQIIDQLLAYLNYQQGMAAALVVAPVA